MAATLFGGSALAHDAHGRSNAPPEARRWKNPLTANRSHLDQGRGAYETNCASCHGADGKARTPLAGKLPVRPTNLVEHVMESMRDGEIFWVIQHGIDKRMPAFDGKLSEQQQWQLVLYVRALRTRQKAVERAKLGPYEWKLPPGFPFPNVPADNPMTKEKVELGRSLFYDKRLSLNQTQSCGTCHQQARAFADIVGDQLGEMETRQFINLSETLLPYATGISLDMLGDIYGVDRLGRQDSQVDAADDNLRFYVRHGTFGDINNGQEIHLPAGVRITSAADGGPVYLTEAARLAAGPAPVARRLE